MFRTMTDTEPAPVVSNPDPVPLSVLELDLDPPTTGWEPFLTDRGIAVLVDDLGRKSISRDNARQLLDDQREAEVRRQEVVKRNEQRAIEADQQWRSRLWPGLPADLIPAGVSAASAMLTAARDAQPKRLTPLQEALANSGSPELTYHSLPSTSDGDES
jgi:hypothetical protein